MRTSYLETPFQTRRIPPFRTLLAVTLLGLIANGILDETPLAAAVDGKAAKPMKDLYFEEGKHVVRRPGLGEGWTLLTNVAVSLLGCFGAANAHCERSPKNAASIRPLSSNDSDSIRETCQRSGGGLEKFSPFLRHRG